MAVEKALPQDLEAEESFLGSVLLDGDNIGLVELAPGDFYEESHGFIYEAMLGLYRDKGKIDQLTVAHQLETDGRMEKVGGVAYLSRLIHKTPTSLHAGHYGKIVRSCALSRRIITAGGQIAMLGYENTDPEDELARSQKILVQIGKMMGVSNLMTPREMANTAMARYVQLREIQPGIPTGIVPFDNRTGGLYKGDYMILAARTSMGKTTLALQMAQNMAVKHNVLFVSLEMGVNAVVDKLVANVIHRPARVLRAGNYSEDLMDMISDSVGQIAELNLYLFRGVATTVTLRAVMEQMRFNYGLDVVFVDYLHLLRDRYGSNANERIGFISGELAAISKEFDVPVIALSQLNRGPDDRVERRPRLADLRESRSLEQDADMVVFMFRESYYDTRINPNGAETQLIIGKDRFRGNTGVLEEKLYWDAERERYRRANG